MLNIDGDRPEQFEKVSEAVLKVIAAACGDTVKEKALDVLQHAAQPSPITVSNCSFVQNTSEDGPAMNIGKRNISGEGPKSTIPTSTKDIDKWGDEF